jgi:hypothetical protein
MALIGETGLGLRMHERLPILNLRMVDAELKLVTRKATLDFFLHYGVLRTIFKYYIRSLLSSCH